MSSKSSKDSFKKSSKNDEVKLYKIPQRRLGGGSRPPTQTRVCFNWQSSGTCRFGDSCRYSHPEQEESHVFTLDISESNTSQLSAEVAQFLNRLSFMTKKPNATIQLDNPRLLDLWKNSWHVASTGSTADAGLHLLRMYMRLPAAKRYAPEPEVVWGTIIHALKSANGRNVLFAAHSAADVIEHRLLPEPTNMHCLEPITELRAIIPTLLAPAVAASKTMTEASQLLTRILMLMGRASMSAEDELSSGFNEPLQTEAKSENEIWLGWQEPTVNWLQKAKWLNAPHLESSYETLESYVDTIRRTTIMLTFYWGAGALFPKCKYKKGTSQDETICGQPLCAPISKALQITCGRKLQDGTQCVQRSTWTCHFKGHPSICSRCLYSTQATLAGKPGRHASTDIYDASLDRETQRRDGNVYILSQVKSRKPPEKGVNWRTTYRLKCAALVGIVRLAFTGQPLRPEMPVEWAEIVSLSTGKGYTDDYVGRQKGCLAIRLLTRNDLPTLKTDHESLQSGAKIAVIDLQVFIPEAIPVLAAVADRGLLHHIQAINFSSVLIGNTSEPIQNALGLDTGTMIQQSLERSEMDIISRVRCKQGMISSLIDLVSKTTLDGTQFLAFCSALSNSIHCTQGPPGTGKSYLGVVLIRALSLIRAQAISSGLGVGPIVVLAYKNHALDEILLDVLKTNEFSKKGELLRCGMPENIELKNHVEWKSNETKDAERLLDQRISLMRSFRRAVKDIKALQYAFKDTTENELSFWVPFRYEHDPDTSNITIAAKWIVRLIYLYSRTREFDQSLPNCSDSYNTLSGFLLDGRTLFYLEDESSSENIEDEKRGLVKERLAFKEISHLSHGNEHWLSHTDESHMEFLISKWLMGENPPPHCLANNEEGCPFAVNNEGQYCRELHGCTYSVNGELCSRKREDSIPFCSNHCCSVGSYQNNNAEVKICSNPRMERSQTCTSHSCPICIDIGSPFIDKKVVHACESHTCHSDNCTLVIFSLQVPFCREHACITCSYYAHNNHYLVKSFVREGGSEFCIDHKCLVVNCGNQRVATNDYFQDYCEGHSCDRCTGARRMVSCDSPRAKLCADHRCLYVLDTRRCVQVRSNNFYCDAHTCMVCKKKGLPLDDKVEEEPPRNVCSKHPLCSLTMPNGELCSNAVPDPTLQFCSEHSQSSSCTSFLNTNGFKEMQCEGLNRKKKRCGAKGPCRKMPYYCKQHIDQRPRSEDESSSSSENERNEEEATSNTFISPADVETLDGLPFSGCKTEVRQFWDDINTSNPGYRKTRYDISNNDSECLSDLRKGAQSRILDVKTEGRLQENYNWMGNDGSVRSQKHTGNATPDEQMSFGIEANRNDYVSANVLTEEINNLETESSESDNRIGNDIMSSSSEDIDDKLGNDVPIDELDISDTEVPENLQHLYEIADRSGAIETSSDEDEESATLENVVEAEDEDSTTANLSLWRWGSSRQERWELAQSFLKYSVLIIEKLISCAEEFVDEARRELADTSAHSLKRATIIGATVVGATRRLQAIRASEPFAMVVEEACEVMEPTLLSVLAVRSLRKLELIGDHRQLPAFIQQCWFNAKLTNPSLQVSLFERLVEGRSSPLTVLDVQRRMRSEICNITRDEYKDTIVIQDDPCTSEQLVADRAASDYSTRTVTEIAEKRGSWQDGGKLVPGILPQVFFWDLDSEEGRAAVGLSRCNNMEADACVSLTRWLILCGVPPKSITLITPYKGQVLTILKKLRAETWYKDDAVHVSSVDRYQGDENDIVILSLVSTRPGNRFVAFRNRFIVATSRARIGFYIVGNSNAVMKGTSDSKGPRHWQTLLDDLRECSATNSELRIGKSVEICCPRHRNTTKKIAMSRNFPSAETAQSFCSEPCAFKLSWCGHSCNLRCHFTDVHHRGKCEEIVERNCERHANVPLKCHVVRDQFVPKSHAQVVRNCSKATTPQFQKALEEYRCEVLVEYRRPECPHTIQLQCSDYEDVIRGVTVLQNCNETVADFVHPSCGHVTPEPKCWERRKWELTPPPCDVKVRHERTCGCEITLFCAEVLEELALDAPPICNVAVVKPRPRCSHSLSCRCNEMTRLTTLWDECDGEKVVGDDPLVYHGVVYGPSETILGAQFEKTIVECKVKTRYLQSCGHITQLTCSDAFLAAAGEKTEGICTALTRGISPLCGHEVEVKCSMMEFIKTAPRSLFVEKRVDGGATTEMIAHENTLLSAETPVSRLRRLTGCCTRHVVIERQCGHRSEPIPCSAIFSILTSKKLPKCKEIIEMRRECQHKYKIECSKSSEPVPSCDAPVDDVFVYPLCAYGHFIRPGICKKLKELRAQDDPLCPIEVDCRRPRCHHVVKVACHLQDTVKKDMIGDCARVEDKFTVVDEGTEYRRKEAGVKNCNETVLLHRECGHKMSDVPCSTAFEWVAFPDDMPPCGDTVTIQSPLCGHNVDVLCSVVSRIASIEVWPNGKLDRVTELTGNLNDFVSIPIVTEEDAEPNWTSEISNLQCGLNARYVRKCGHVDDIPCSGIFNAIKSPCEHILNVTCDDCNQVRRIKCVEEVNQRSIPCSNMVKKMCSICGVNFKKVECSQEKVMCENTVSVDQKCGHSVSWACGDQSDPRLTDVPCVQCKLAVFKKALGLYKSDTGNRIDCQSVILDADGSFQNVLHLKESLQIRASEDPALSEFAVLETTHTDVTIRAENIQRALVEILQGHVDVLSRAIENNQFDNEADLRDLLLVSDVDGSYDFVFQNAKDRDNFPHVFKPRHTPYGHGSQAMLLNARSLKEIASCSSSDDGSLLISVAAALRFRGCKGLHPFAHNGHAMSGKNNRKKGNMGKQGYKNISRQVQEQRAHGYDYVDMVPGRKEKNPEILQRVYWVPGSMIPLFKMKIAIKRECEICKDWMLPQKGWLCSKEHFLCRDCFDHHVEHASQPGALERSIDGKGNVKCPHDGCDSVFDPLSLVKQRHDASDEELRKTHEKLQNIRMELYSKEVAAEAVDTERRKLQAEFDRINSIRDKNEREAELVKLKIVDEILTLRCPNKDCKMAFIDFDGCFAVTCSSCRHSFCAWCLDFSQRGDVHGHVANCPKSFNRGLYGRQEDFEQAQNTWKKAKVIQQLKDVENVDIRKNILNILSSELEDLNIKIFRREVNL